jgi:ABC-2 type transport system permease protein
MINDISTLIWKEWKEIFLQRSNSRGGVINLFLVVGIVGIFIPLQSGRYWFTNPVTMLIWAWLPIFLVLGMVTDAFAGERERHTLETLLASRLSDNAILFGKLGASVAYGWSMALVSMFLGAISVNLVFPEGGFAFYPLANLLLGILLAFLGCLMIGLIGVLVSLRAPTARAAYQQLSIVMLIIYFVPILGLQFLPASFTGPIFQWLAGIQLIPALLGLAGGMLVANLALFAIARVRFQRARLIENG